MNIVTIKIANSSQYQLGDIFKDPADGENVFMLAETGAGGYCTVSLRDGKCYNSPCKTLESAISGLTFYSRGCKISIE